MIINTIQKAGGWADVVAHPSGFVMLYDNGSGQVVALHESGAVLFAFAVPFGIAHFLRTAVDGNGNILCAWQGHAKDDLYIAWNAQVTQIQGYNAFGQNPVAVRFNGGQFHLLAMQTATSYARLAVSNGIAAPIELVACPLTSQGFLGCAESGQPVWTDTERIYKLPDGRALLLPNRAGDLIVGQHESEQSVIYGTVAGSSKRFKVLLGAWFEPHIAQQGNRYAVCARPATMSIVTEPFVDEPAQQPQQPQKPDQPTQPKPMSIPNYSDLLGSVGISLGGPGTDTERTARAFAFTNKLATLCKQRDRNFGVLFKNAGNNVSERSVDLLAYKVADGRLALIDVVSSSESPSAKAGWNVKPENEWFADQSRYRDPYPAVVQPEPQPVPDLPDPVVLEPQPDAAVLAKLDEIKAAIQAASDREIAKLDELKTSIIKASKDLGKLLPLLLGGGLGGILGGRNG